MREIILILITVVFSLVVGAMMAYAFETDNGIYKFMLFAASTFIAFLFALFIISINKVREEIEKKGD